LWTCGNSGFLDFHESTENDFQPVCWKCKKSREAAIFQISKVISMDTRAPGRLDAADASLAMGGP
jgi:hypothetical protein